MRGLVPATTVEIVAVDRHGEDAATVFYRSAVGPGQQLLDRDDESRLLMEEREGSPNFTADGHLFKLVAEAQRIRLAHLFDPMLAVTTSTLEPLPHQIQAVYGELLPRQPLRFLLADDPGAGKTIMAGLLIKELLLRGDLQRCLVVAPGSLVEQWQDELVSKFDLRFTILSRELVQASQAGDPFDQHPLLIARVDALSRNEELLERLRQSEWDLVVVDEAHRMSAHYFGAELKETRRYRLGRLLGEVTRHLLLMTATPHAGKEQDFQLFLALLDPDRFEGRYRPGVHDVEASDLMRRMVKERLLTFEGRPLFPERRAATVPFRLSEDERLLYEEVTRYVREQMDRADRVGGRRGNTVGFALTVLQRRLASSPEAIYQSLARRRRRLEDRLADLRSSRKHPVAQPDEARVPDYDEATLDDLDAGEREELEDEVVDAASAAESAAELGLEIAELQRLERVAHEVRNSGHDVKWQELAGLLHERTEMFDVDGQRRKLIVFTEHRDTLNYLVDRLRALMGYSEAVVAIHGGLSRSQRRTAQGLFTQDKDCLVLVATDAAGEGINLQRAHLLINYDLPWNPNRIEQRFGRVHRIGQTEVCHMWNLVAGETREGAVFQRLLQKIEIQSKAYHGQVFDVLGKAFEGQPLSRLLLDAVRYGDRPEVRARLDEVVDAAVGEGMAALIERDALDSSILGAPDVERLRMQMEEAQARRLQPRYIAAFFLAAFAHAGGRCAEREPGRWEVTQVPASLRRRPGHGADLLRRYQRITFTRELRHVAGRPEAELVAPGHPLLDAAVDALLDDHDAILLQGATLIDDGDSREDVRVLLAIQHRITSGGDPERVISQRFQFLERSVGGTIAEAGPAPYLDYRPATIEEQHLLDGAGLREGFADQADREALEWAVRTVAPAHRGEVRERTERRIDRTGAAVRARLSAEIDYWDNRANELADQERAGRQPKINPARARQRAEDLAERLRRREMELERERDLSSLPPVIVGAALVVPGGALARLRGERTDPPDHATATEEVDRRAVAAVMGAEVDCGREPEEMPHHNPGYDIRSRTPDGHLLLIEVKGRIAGAETVTVTRNEILQAQNVPKSFVLALVRVSPDGAQSDEVRYVRRPFEGLELATRFGETSVTFPLRRMWQEGEVPS